MNFKNMEKFLDGLKAAMPFKDTTESGDVVFFAHEADPERVGTAYAYVQGFDLDASKRDEWWHVHFLFLETPPRPHTITLQRAHFTGQEIFTMGGKPVFIKAIDLKAFDPRPEPSEKEPQAKPSKPSFTLVK